MTVAAIVDCSATALFISERLIKTSYVYMHLLAHPIPLYNIDSSKNKAESIAWYICLHLWVGEVEEWWEFLIMDLGPEDMILGLLWLRSLNLRIDWAEGMMEVEPRWESLKSTSEESAKIKQIFTNCVQHHWWWKAKVLDDPSEWL